ncbi:MAG TPA: hypothetical protein VHX92_00155 [Rhizomicrobium sp.]|jgi:hypothetical protein|nr:hypothetical protein [Rhizomicrobium sp.]
MRISKAALNRGWIWATGLGVIAYAALTLLDMQLKSLTGVSTADLEGLGSAAQFRLAFHAWASEPYAARAGFLLGFAFLTMPLYALSFFFSGVIVAERFTPGKSRFRRWVLLAAMVAPVGALLDAGLRAAELAMLLSGADAGFARIAASLAQGKTVAVTVGFALLIGALVARFEARRKKE